MRAELRIELDEHGYEAVVECDQSITPARAVEAVTVAMRTMLDRREAER